MNKDICKKLSLVTLCSFGVGKYTFDVDDLLFAFKDTLYEMGFRLADFSQLFLHFEHLLFLH